VSRRKPETDIARRRPGGYHAKRGATLTPAEFQQLRESFQERLVQDPDMAPTCLRVGWQFPGT